ncbi:EboA domain-containing protein [Catenovulum sp. 2E275]|uniref:EboA domain-containing protein n=1 Tax=Catenovulum sp. 2E275 TaxID=2980497 RepID=UPI0021CF05F4|nr:EboA domain-containing protein [Catenovulum sp. 2E275]MCU4676155.1 EboA domain-containing protein [Catenovulum sp. 2E275]
MQITNDIKLIEKQLNQSQQDWLIQALAKLSNCQQNAEDIELELLNQSVLVKRLFSQTISLNSPYKEFELADFIRLILLKAALEILSSIHLNDAEQYQQAIKTLLKNYYQYGDESEKCALLKSLSFIDHQGLAVQTAIKACRCNSLNEYSAIALNNPYPAAYFPELNFNQLVLKSLFMGLNIEQITDLTKRLNQKLSNMCFSYAIEQALADRIPPDSIWQGIIFDQLDDENKSQLTHYLMHFKQQNHAHDTQIQKALTEQNALNLLV